MIKKFLIVFFGMVAYLCSIGSKNRNKAFQVQVGDWETETFSSRFKFLEGQKNINSKDILNAYKNNKVNPAFFDPYIISERLSYIYFYWYRNVSVCIDRELLELISDDWIRLRKNFEFRMFFTSNHIINNYRGYLAGSLILGSINRISLLIIIVKLYCHLPILIRRDGWLIDGSFGYQLLIGSWVWGIQTLLHDLGFKSAQKYLVPPRLIMAFKVAQRVAGNRFAEEVCRIGDISPDQPVSELLLFYRKQIDSPGHYESSCEHLNDNKFYRFFQLSRASFLAIRTSPRSILSNRHFADDFGIPYVFINGFFILGVSCKGDYSLTDDMLFKSILPDLQVKRIWRRLPARMKEHLCSIQMIFGDSSLRVESSERSIALSYDKNKLRISVASKTGYQFSISRVDYQTANEYLTNQNKVLFSGIRYGDRIDSYCVIEDKAHTIRVW